MSKMTTTLGKRLNYYGGFDQEKRMINDKLRSLRQALHYSYQAETAILEDGREFKCLINPDKNKPDYDNKIISIPYKDICLNKHTPRLGGDILSNSESHWEEEIGLKCGDTFCWKETNTHWLVDLEDIEENAYFRSEIRRCDQQVEVEGKPYWVYIRGPVETVIQWNSKDMKQWNDLNYSLVMYITKNEDTLKFFHRFAKLKIEGETWQVTDANTYYADGIIEVMLDEYFNNELEEERIEREEIETMVKTAEAAKSEISGPITIHPYQQVTYSIEREDGLFETTTSCKLNVIEATSSSLTFIVMSGKRNHIQLKYIVGESAVTELSIDVESLT